MRKGAILHCAKSAGSTPVFAHCKACVLDAYENGGHSSGHDRSPLALGDALVSFVVPVERSPREGQPVIIEGYLDFKSLTRSGGGSWRGDWKVRLVGQVVGEWVPMVAPKPMLPLPQRGTRTSLTEFIREHGAQSLLVLSTHTAHLDLAQSMASGGCDEQPAFMEANFGAADAFLHTLTTIPTDSNVRGLAVVRGGGNALDVIAGSREVVAALLNTGLPFYTALGHDTDVSLADRSADQVLHSPSELGAVIARAVRDADDRTAQARRVSAQSTLLDQQKAKLDEQARKMAEFQAEAIRAGDAAKARASNLRNLLIGAGLLVAFLLWLLVEQMTKLCTVQSRSVARVMRTSLFGSRPRPRLFNELGYQRHTPWDRLC